MWYRTGTITVTNGSTAVTGSGTTWIANAGIGEALYAPDGRLYEIANISSDTSITLATPYLGSNASGQTYVIVPSQSYIRDLAAQAADLVNNYSTIYNTVGQGKFPDGTLAAPAIRFSDDLDTGFYRSASNEVTFVAGGVAQFKYNASGLQFSNGGTLIDLTTSGNTTLGDASTDTVTINATTTANAPMVVSANSTTNALRITQTGTGNALVVEDSANPDGSPFVIDSSGQVLIGSATSVTGNSGAAKVQSNFLIAYSAVYNGVDTNPPIFDFLKNRGGAIVNSSDDLGRVAFQGYDGTNYIRSAQIVAAVDGTPGTNDMPGRLVFSTTADGASSPTEAMRIDSAGRVGIGGTPGTDSLGVYKNLTGSINGFHVAANYTIQSDVTAAANSFTSFPTTAASAFTLADLRHFYAWGRAFGAGSTVTNQYGFNASSSLTGATNNYGFYSNIASGTGRWNFYANGTAANYFGGNVIQKLSASVTPANNSEMMVELTSNTSLTIKVKGTDGTVRSVSLTLA